MALHPLYAVCTLLHGFSFHLKAPLEGMFGLRELFQIIRKRNPVCSRLCWSTKLRPLGVLTRMIREFERTCGLTAR